MSIRPRMCIVCVLLFIAAVNHRGEAQQPRQNSPLPSELRIPDVADIPRIEPGQRPSRMAARQSAFILKTKPHPIQGEAYFILTDHNKPEFLDPLDRLAKHRDGIVIAVDDLAQLHRDQKRFEDIRRRLADEGARYVAIAPKMESFRENMLLGMWQLLTRIDDDPQLDVMPGVLLASSADHFAKLITRTIAHRPESRKSMRPLAISQVPSQRETRSLQKAGVLRKLFARQGLKTPVLAIYSPNTDAAPQLDGPQSWVHRAAHRRDFLKQLPVQVAPTFDDASLIVMHGHGIPGMSCGLDVSALPADLNGKVLLCGSCFAAAPQKSDFPAMVQAPGGYQVQQRDAFIVRAIDHGANVAFGHMRLSSGFPHLFPVLEQWLKGKTVGEGYQQLINALINARGDRGKTPFVIEVKSGAPRNLPGMKLLYVVIGDPALQPFEAQGD